MFGPSAAYLSEKSARMALAFRQPQTSGEAENPFYRHLARIDQPGLDIFCPLFRQLTDIVFSDLEIGQHQFFHFFNRQILLQANDVARLGKFGFLVGACQISFVLFRRDLNAIQRVTFITFFRVSFSF